MRPGREAPSAVPNGSADGGGAAGAPGGVSRRELLRQLAVAAASAATGAFNLEAARVVHAFAAEKRAQPGGYVPRFLTAPEYATLTRLAELVVPADAGGGSAVDAGAPEFIDLLCSENERLADIYRGGLAWLDEAMNRAGNGAFAGAPVEAQTALLDALVAAERAGGASGLEPGVRFFVWVRRMTVDAYYTSPIGIRDVGYQGNRILSAYETPRAAVEFIERAAEDLGL